MNKKQKIQDKLIKNQTNFNLLTRNYINDTAEVNKEREKLKKQLKEDSELKLVGETQEKHCKAQHNEKMKIHKRTKKGLATKLYAAQNFSSKKRGHDFPTYTKKEFTEWLYSQQKFHTLYDNWKRLDFQKAYIPSVDRKDDYMGYTLSNIQLMTWGENNAKGHADTKSGKNNKRSKTVIQYSLDGCFINEYHSICETNRATGINRANISACCNQDRRSAGGYIWKFKKDGELTL